MLLLRGAMFVCHLTALLRARVFRANIRVRDATTTTPTIRYVLHGNGGVLQTRRGVGTRAVV